MKKQWAAETDPPPTALLWKPLAFFDDQPFADNRRA
jgi:hypothetical protein